MDVTGLTQGLPALSSASQAALLAAIFTHSTEGMAFIDPGLVFLAVNDGFARKLGMPVDQIAGKRISEVLPVWKSQVEDIFRQVRDTLQPFETEVSPHAPGNVVAAAAPWDGSLSPVVGPSGDFLGWLLFHQTSPAKLKHAEEESRLEREFLERLLEKAPVGIAVVTVPDHRCQMANPYYRAIPGMADIDDQGQVSGDGCLSVVGDGMTLVDRVVETGEPFGLREYPGPAGTPREDTYWDVEYAPLTGSTGEVDRVLILAREVTPRVRARREAEANLLQLQAAIDSIGDGLTIWDSDGTLRVLNAAGYRILGFMEHQDSSTRTGRIRIDEVARFVELRDLDGRVMPFEEWPVPRILRGEVLSGVELELRRLDTGETRMLSVTGMPVRHLAGAPGMAVVTLRNITEEKRAQAEREQLIAMIRESNERLIGATMREQVLKAEAEHRAMELDTIISSMANGVMVFDLEGRMLRQNPAAERILAFSEEERALTWKERVERIRPEMADGKVIAWQEIPPIRAIRGEETTDVVQVFHRPHGSIRTSMNNAPVRGVDGEVVAVVSTFVDITAQHELEELRADLLRAVSHDMRGPLTVIMGHAQMLERALGKMNANEFALRSVSSIVTSARRVNAMMEDLVESNRLEAGQVRIDSQAVELGHFLQEFMERNRWALQSARVKLEIADDLPLVQADPNRLERVLMNLIGNSMKYSPKGGEVAVRATTAEHEVTVSVSDQGVGIREEDMPRLFERFFRGSSAPRTEGLGLGLYITKLLVEAMGGRIWAASIPGKGSTFYFTLRELG